MRENKGTTDPPDGPPKREQQALCMSYSESNCFVDSGESDAVPD